MQWDEYEPKSSDEFEVCGYCRMCEKHTVSQHKNAVKKARKAQCKREDSLYRYAQRVYDYDRD